jgi:hypothetical protein
VGQIKQEKQWGSERLRVFSMAERMQFPVVLAQVAQSKLYSMK